MDKEFWASIAKNDYAIPAGHTLNELKEILFGYLGSTDPELRDDIAYMVYANWLKREMFTKDEVRAHIDELLANLDKGIGDTESDSVFLRTFSVLLLAEISIMTIKSLCLRKTRSNPFSPRDYGISTRKKTRADISPSKAGRTRWLTLLI